MLSSVELYKFIGIEKRDGYHGSWKCLKGLLHHIIFNGTVLYDMFSEKTLNIRMIYLVVGLVLVSGKEAQRSNLHGSFHLDGIVFKSPSTRSSTLLMPS